MSNLRNAIESLRAAFERLSQREQLVLLGGGVAAALMITLAVGFGISGAIDNAENRVKFKTEALSEILQLQGEYKARQQEQQARMGRLRGNVRLVSLVEEAARSAQVQIGQLRPEEKTLADGVTESSVALKASNLSIDRLEAFLEHLENAQGIVLVNRMRINKPYRKDTLEIDLTVVTYRVKG